LKANQKIYLLILCLLFCFDLLSQELSNNFKSPKRAAILSASLPGLGQVYNKKYWKVPIIYTGILTSLYYIKDNNKKYKNYKGAYLKRLDNNSNNDSEYIEYSSIELLTLKDFYRRNREISILCLFGSYIINIIDASIDAHLFDYDISEDISLNISPITSDQLNGISLTLNL